MDISAITALDLKIVSMKSGLEGRNNGHDFLPVQPTLWGLNEVRPRRPEQYDHQQDLARVLACVSMKSGLEGRNNSTPPPPANPSPTSQ